MLVLSRRRDESIVIEGGIRITVVGIRGNQVRVGIEAPDHIGIYREELCLPLRDVGQGALPSAPPESHLASARVGSP
jgi:carbon storage regulator